MEKVKVHIDSIRYTEKPTGKMNGAISTRLSNSKPVEVTAKELAKLVGEEGRTVVMAQFNKKTRRKEDFKELQVLMLDFDNEDKGYQTTGIFYQTIEETLEDDFIKENASFIYKTFSHTDGWDRFRVVFILDKPLTTNQEVDSAYRYLMDKYPNADVSTKDSSRYFFGGTEVIEIEYDNQLSVEDLPEVEIKAIKPRRESAIKEITHAVDPMAYEYETPTWMLIKEGKKDEVARRWRKYGTGRSFEDRVHARDFFRNLDMRELLGLPGNPFHDIFDYDETPSMGIWYAEDTKTYLYTKLNEVGETGGFISYDLIQIVAKLTGATMWGAIQYLVDTTGIDFEISEKLTEIREQADMFRKILRSGTLKEQHPEMYKIFGRYDYNTRISTILEIIMDQMYEYNGEIEMISWVSSKNIAKRLGVGHSTAKRMLNLMTLTKIIDKLSDDEIPKDLLEILKRNQEYVMKENGEYVKRGTKRERRSNAYTVGELMENFNEVEEWSVMLVDRGFTMKGFSVEYMLNTFGEEEAYRVFPQDEGRTVSQVSQEMSNLYVKIVMENIQDKGYMIVNEIVDEARRVADTPANWTDYKYKQQEAGMLEGYGLEKRGLTNELKEELNITHLHPNARPQVLLQA